MRCLSAVLCGLLVACGGPGGSPGTDEATATRTPSYATVTDARATDYAALLRQHAETADSEIERPASALPPHDAKAIGDLWTQRLNSRGLADGWGVSGPDGVVEAIDVLTTAREFDTLAARNGWQVPDFIAWRFQPEFVAPAVGEAAEEHIRIWPATTRRTGLQNMAALYGRIILRDGCFYVRDSEGGERLAWFLAETGLAVDGEGYLVLVDRTTGQTMARVGEDMVWAGPNAGPAQSVLGPLREACGEGAVASVGNPQSQERFDAQFPQARDPNPPPPPRR